MIPQRDVQPEWCLGRPATILVVDDASTNVELLNGLLRKEGHCVDVAYDGGEALETVRRKAPDLILMDVMMPKMDGFEACRRIKADPGTYLIPVVLVTSLDDSDSRIQGLEAGADDFISKPFNAHELRARVRSLLRIKRCTEDLESAESVVLSLALTVEARDAYTEGHCERLVNGAREGAGGLFTVPNRIQSKRMDYKTRPLLITVYHRVTNGFSEIEGVPYGREPATH